MPMECNIIFTPFGVSVIFFASLCLSMKTSGGNFLNDKSLVNTEAVMKVFWLCSTFSLSNFYMDIFLVCLMKLRRSLIFRFKYLNFVSKLYSLSKHFYLCIPCSKSSFSHFAFLSYLKQKKFITLKMIMYIIIFLIKTLLKIITISYIIELSIVFLNATKMYATLNSFVFTIFQIRYE